MEKKILSHFKTQDPILFALLVKIGSIQLLQKRQAREYFISLCREIVGQQLSGKAAGTIFQRFLDLFPNKKVTPDQIIKFDEQTLRNVGMSWAKARYIKDLAAKVTAKEVHLEILDELSDKEVIVELTKIKGIGVWTAEMFCMFALGRQDLFSHGDLGLRKGLQKVYGLKHLPTTEQAENIIAKWSPYKTYGALAMWKSLEI